jgi:acyl-CoA synthetase (AMP-forming)/AMP-acid ligase II
VLKSQATSQEIIEFAASQLANYKRIAEVEFVGHIPKSPSGKILRRVLIEQERARA